MASRNLNSFGVKFTGKNYSTWEFQFRSFVTGLVYERRKLTLPLPQPYLPSDPVQIVPSAIDLPFEPTPIVLLVDDLGATIPCLFTRISSSWSVWFFRYISSCYIVYYTYSFMLFQGYSACMWREAMAEEFGALLDNHTRDVSCLTNVQAIGVSGFILSNFVLMGLWIITRHDW